jgi:hypothetical protein
MSNRRTTGQARLWAGGIGVAVAAAAVIGMGTAHADTPDDVLGQAVTVINEGDTLLATAPTADLGTESADLLSRQENLGGLDSDLNQLASLQDQLTPTDQTFLASADEQFVSAAQNVLSADQAFVAADQAGELSGSGGSLTDLTVLYADLGLISADFNVTGDEIIAALTGGVDPSSAADVASTLDPAAVAAAPTTPADLLSEATTNYTDANQLLADLPSGPSGADYAQDVATEIQVQDKLLQGIANVGSAESALSSYDNGVLADFLNPGFTSVDQGWDQVSEAALNADQALESAAATGSATDVTTAVLGLIGPEYQAIGPALQSDFIDVAAHLLTGGDFTSAADLAAGVDPVSALDPGIFADLLSSIGL